MAYAYPEVWLASAVNAATGVDAHPVMAPEDAVFPFVVYQRTGTERPLAINPKNRKHAYLHHAGNDLHTILYAGERHS